MAKSSERTIGDILVAKAVIAHEAVDCVVGNELAESEQRSGAVSCIGGAFHGRPWERWPTASDGEPLIPWLQVVCAELGHAHGAFFRKQAVAFYIRRELPDYCATAAMDAADFVVREYERGEALVPLVRPTFGGHPFRRVTWSRLPDYPSLSKYYGLFDKPVYDALCDDRNLGFQNRSGIKVGGWPTPVQRKQKYPGSCDLQIDVTSNYSYGDSGIGYLSRTGGTWHVTFECC